MKPIAERGGGSGPGGEPIAERSRIDFCPPVGWPRDE